MKEIKEIVKAYEKAAAAGMRTALATVVSVEGSSYRRPGARMLITEDGQLTGAISGGCLEGDALRKALYVMSAQKPMVVTYDTTDEDDAKVGVGLGCNGIIRILIEPINGEVDDNPVALLKSVLARRQPAVVVTVFSFDKSLQQQPGTCFLFFPGEPSHSAAPRVYKSFAEEASIAFDQERSFSIAFETENFAYTALIALIKPSVSLIIFGAGNDAIPVAQVAGIPGWDVTIIDGRRNYATAQRFPSAKHVRVLKPDEALAELILDKQTVAVLMTHNYNYDLAIFRKLLEKDIRYIGLLGPRKRLQRMIDELKVEGVSVDEQQLDKVYGPVGLDLGAETAEEIAISIVAEIKAVLNKKPGSSLRSKEGPIHQPFHSSATASVTGNNE